MYYNIVQPLGLFYLPMSHKKDARLIWVKVAPKLSIFLYNTMETTGVRQGMGITHSNVMDTFFHSYDA